MQTEPPRPSPTSSPKRPFDAQADIRAVIQAERLLPESLLRRLHATWPAYSRLVAPPPPVFQGGRARYAGLEGLREVDSILRAHGIEIGHMVERELFADVYRFMATRHILNSIDWRTWRSDPMFQLVFPQPGMLGGEGVERYRSARTRAERERVAAEYKRQTNPHDGKQLLNKPWLTDASGHMHLLHGSQHKYPQVQLLFDETTQDCFSFCTYCFRHAQVRGDEDMFVQRDVEQVHAYLREHEEVTDLLITGGDAGFMPAARLQRYIEPLLTDPALLHVSTVRLGSRALTFQPEMVLKPGYAPTLELFSRLRDHGMQMAWMAHFSTPQEVLQPYTLAAIRRLQNHGVLVRSQSPIMRHVSMYEDEQGGIDIERSAQNWIDLGRILGSLSIGFHSIYCARPTGEHHWFSAPLADVSRIFNRVHRSLASIARPSRHLSMTTSAGKITILGTTEVGGETLFALKFSEGRNMRWLDRVFLAKHDEQTRDVKLLKPHEGESFFFEDELAQIEAELVDALAAAQGET